MIDVDYLERVFPTYLSDASKIRLATSLKNRNNSHYFSTSWDGPPEPIQGDGWSNFSLVMLTNGERRAVSGIVCSNSCDIDTHNAAMRNRNVLFAPITPLNKYIDALTSNDISLERIQDHVDSIKRQEKTEYFYLPASNKTPECIVMLDEIQPQPLQTFINGSAERLLFRLNNFGFYMFLMKLAIHFSRFGEAIDRETGPIPA